MTPIDFSTLFENSTPPLPALIKLSQPRTETGAELASWYFTSDNEDIEWEGQLYKAVPMSYRPPSSRDGIPSGGTLEIDIDIQDKEGNELLAWFDRASDKAEMRVVAIIHEEEIKPVGLLRHHHGTVTWDGKKISWSPGWDDRLQMQINPVSFDADALTGAIVA